ncbi:UDP-N-acetylmuramoyl-tripeptide--D-alanyl-D-alanine ligase [Brachybacterium huguangmaarense]
MLSTTAARIAEITGGRLVDGATGDEAVTGRARIDSRAVEPGDLFAAFDGENVDGHDFVTRAASAGAALALVSRPAGAPAVLVEDVERALSDLARAQLDEARARRAGTDEPLVVVAVTGSAGKTGTKDLLGELLSAAGPVVAPAGSHNNELGLPLTVLGIDEGTRFLVLEMGARGVGHIAHLTAIARPDISLVLNVGSAHLGEFGSVEAIARAKGEIVEALEASGRAVLNAEDPRVAAMAERTDAPVVMWGIGQGDVRAQDVRLSDDARASFELVVGDGLVALDGTAVAAGTRPVELGLVGEHQVMNALAAATAAVLAGVALDAIPGVLAAARSVSGQRMEVTELPGGITLVNDAYNANPDSMRLALRTLAHMGRGRRTIAVLGEMLELGDDSVALHDAVGRLAVRLNIGLLVAVGPGGRAIHNGASLEGSFGGESVHVEDLDAALAVLETTMRPGDVVLLKSSRDAGVRALAPRLITLTSGGSDA